MNYRRKDNNDDAIGLVVIFLVACCVLGVLYLSYHAFTLFGLVALVALALIAKLYHVEYWDNYTVVDFFCFIPVILSVYWIVDIEYPQSVLDSAKGIERFEGIQYIVESVKLAWHTALNIKVIVFCHIVALGAITTACIANIMSTHSESPARSVGLVLSSIIPLLLANLNLVPTWLYNHFQI